MLVRWLHLAILVTILVSGIWVEHKLLELSVYGT